MKDRTGQQTHDSKVYVSNISWEANDQDLIKTFGKVGTVVEVQVIRERGTGKLCGFGFVTMLSPKEAGQAKRVMNGWEMMGRVLRVMQAKRGGASGNAMLRKENSAKVVREDGDEVDKIEKGYAMTVRRGKCKDEDEKCMAGSDEEIDINYSCFMSTGRQTKSMSENEVKGTFVGIVDSGCSSHITPFRNVSNQRKGGGKDMRSRMDNT